MYVALLIVAGVLLGLEPLCSSTPGCATLDVPTSPSDFCPSAVDS
jgi:hypothetical protein